MHHQFVCPNGTLHLGYVPDFFPYIWTDEYGKTRGIFVDLWATLTPRLGCNSVEYKKYSRQRELLWTLLVFIWENIFYNYNSISFIYQVTAVAQSLMGISQVGKHSLLYQLLGWEQAIPAIISSRLRLYRALLVSTLLHLFALTGNQTITLMSSICAWYSLLVDGIRWSSQNRCRRIIESILLHCIPCWNICPDNCIFTYCDFNRQTSGDSEKSKEGWKRKGVEYFYVILFSNNI